MKKGAALDKKTNHTAESNDAHVWKLPYATLIELIKEMRNIGWRQLVEEVGINFRTFKSFNDARFTPSRRTHARVKAFIEKHQDEIRRVLLSISRKRVNEAIQSIIKKLKKKNKKAMKAVMELSMEKLPPIVIEQKIKVPDAQIEKELPGTYMIENKPVSAKEMEDILNDE